MEDRKESCTKLNCTFKAMNSLKNDLRLFDVEFQRVENIDCFNLMKLG